MCTTETWKPVPGYEGRYEVSDLGRVRSVDVRVAYNHWRSGERLVRLKRGRQVATQHINSGYEIVHLHADNKRQAFLVHRLVAQVFLPPADATLDVNHKDGRKDNNAANNLEWLRRSANHDHAVDLGLNLRAIPVRCPKTGKSFPSISRAARETGHCHKYVAENFERTTRT